MANIPARDPRGGASYRQLRSRRNAARLNNGEPVSEAVRKILVQLAVLALLAAVAVGAYYGYSFLKEFLAQLPEELPLLS